jgi:ERF superfamily
MNMKPKMKQAQDLLGTIDPVQDAEPTMLPTQARMREARPNKERKSPDRSQLSEIHLLTVIAEAAADPRVDPAKMRTLLDMRKELKEEAARAAFVRAYIDLQGELPVINARGLIEIPAKGGGRGQRTKYATYEEILRVCKPILKAHGFDCWCEPDVGEDSRIIVIGHLDHVDGHERRCRFALPLDTSGSKNSVQSVGASVTYGKRYCWLTLLGITSNAREDRDDEKQIEGVAVIDAAQMEKLKEAIKLANVTEEYFCKFWKVETVTELPAARFKEAVAACENKARQGK